MDITHAITSLRPGASWSLHGDSYDGLIWSDSIQPKPTQEELEEELTRLQTILDARKSWADKSAFWAEFTDQEKAMILISSDPRLKVLYSELTMWSGEIWSDDYKIQAGFTLLKETNILTDERVTAILLKS